MARSSAPRSTRILAWVIAAIVFLVALAGALYWLVNRNGPADQAAAAEMPPPPVTVYTVQRTQAEIINEYAGRVQGSREVEVRARVGGILEERLYREGAAVSQGDSLFQIETAPFEAELQSAIGELQTAQAELRQAEREWNRVSRLFERGASTEHERDTARTALEFAEARTTVAEARVAQTRLQLDWTRVTAPVPGITSLEVLPEGSLLERGALLTTIVQQDPVHVRFSVPENDAVTQRAARRALGGGVGETHRYETTLVLPGGQLYREPGEIDFAASTIDPRTGTVLGRAVFPNPDNEVVPGQFVRLRIRMRPLDNVFIVPERAVSQGPQGPQVFVVGDGDIAEARPIELGPTVEQGQVVTTGLEDGHRVVVSGHVALAPGMAVAIVDTAD